LTPRLACPAYVWWWLNVMGLLSLSKGGPPKQQANMWPVSIHLNNAI
jgi:hypothetical protein